MRTRFSAPMSPEERHLASLPAPPRSGGSYLEDPGAAEDSVADWLLAKAKARRLAAEEATAKAEAPTTPKAAG